MPCACRVNREIAKLRKYYGVGKEQKESDIRGSVEVFFKKIFSGAVVIVLSPLLLLHLFIHLILHKGKPIKIDNFVKFGHGRNK